MTRKSQAKKPEKPRPDFPLSAHPSGQWCKRIHSKLYYFGPWDDPEGALAEYERRRPVITGERPDTAGATVDELVNRFLHTKRLLLDAGELTQRTWSDYKDVGTRLVSHFGSSRPIGTLSSQDFEHLRGALPEGWGPTTTNNFVIRTKAFLNYALSHELVDKPIRTGEAFKRTTAKRQRIERASKPRKFFSAAEIHAMCTQANPVMRAMILLGVNCGYGNADCSRLTKSMIQNGWIIEPREKTGVLRMARLWPETQAAIDAVINTKRKPVPKHLADHVFVTRKGNPYWTDGGHDAISTAFYRLRVKCGVKRDGVGFYSLRHVTQTIGERTGDQLAVAVVMGHIDDSISEKYREDFDRKRVFRVCRTLRNWYLKKQK